MIRDGVYFENQYGIIREAMKTAKKSIDIAVAWVNFSEYKDVMRELLQNGVKIRVIVNDDVINSRYVSLLEDLQSIGLKLKKFQMPKSKSYMHHKFCIIDSYMCIMGSFNWTKNANENNFEDLCISHVSDFVDSYKTQFETIWALSTDDIKILRNPKYCELCGHPQAYLCTFEQEGSDQTKADIYNVCECGLRFINNEFFDSSVYLNLMGIFEKNSDMDEEDFMMGFEFDKQERTRQMDYEVNKYLSKIRNNRMGFPIIHAVGTRCWQSYPYPYKDDGEYVIKVLWKERYTSNYISDEYSIN